MELFQSNDKVIFIMYLKFEFDYMYCSMIILNYFWIFFYIGKKLEK